jgi:CDP-diacylglycerol--glycerol-3-phosphate 3-phosphatidyltransferase
LGPPARLIGRLGIGPTAFTLWGLALAGAAGLAFAVGRLRTGALLVLGAGLADMLDGAVARACGRESKFGAFIDSVLDRYGEAAYFTGLIYYYAAGLDKVMAVLAAAVLAGSLLVSYAKARAEGLLEKCDVGLMERPERMILLALGYLVGGRGPLVAMAVLAVFSHFTAVQRILYVRKRLSGRAGD